MVAKKSIKESDKETDKPKRRTRSKTETEVKDVSVSVVKRRTRSKPKTEVKDVSVKDNEVKDTEVRDVSVKETSHNPNYYSITKLDKEDADFNLIIGERGNGKTYAIQNLVINDYLNGKGQFFLLRRWVEDVKPANAQNFIDGNLVNRLSELTNGKFTTIKYDVGKYVLATNDKETNRLKANVNDTIGYVWSITEAERLKGQSFPNVKNIILEEFISLSTNGYDPDEINKFTNILSTIIRDRTNVKVWLLGNTVNPYNPYFEYFGIKGLDLKQGEIWTKTDTITGCKLAVEYCTKRRKGSLYGTSAKYYAFGNNEMIVGGKWQLPKVPELTRKEFNKTSSKILFEYCILFDEQRLKMLLCRDSKGNKFIWVSNYKPKTDFKNIKVFLDLVPNRDKRYFNSILNLPIEACKDTLIECLTNGKVWFRTQLIGSYFSNFINQSHFKNQI